MRKLLILILVVAAFFRFYRLDSVPPSPSLDEVSIGWNAYSILKTGRDEYGHQWPILLRAYDDWRPALYVYLVVPFVKLFGLSVVAVRLASVLLSLLTVLVTYFLVRELFPAISPRRSPPAGGHRPRCLVALFSAFLLAISPWHIYLSRLGHEVNAGLTLVVLGIFFFLKMKLVWAALFFAFSFYTYQSEKLFVPLLIVVLGLIFKKQLLVRKKELILASLIGLIVFLPILKASLTPEALVRFSGTSIFSAADEVYQRSSQRLAHHCNFLSLLFDNRRVAMGLTVLRAYFSHFNPTWLFFNSGEEKHKVPGMGLFYLWELPLLLIGGYQLIKSKFSKKSKVLIFSWLLLAPLAASITTEAPHAMRTFNFLPMPQIIAALGAAMVMSNVKCQMSNLQLKTKNFLALILLTVLLLFNFAYLFHNYFVNFPFEQSESFQLGLRQAIEQVLKIENKYQKIVFSNQNHGYQSYMFFLFFSQYDPFVYQKQGGTVSGGYNESHQFAKYEFRPIDWGKEQEKGSVLYVGNIDDFPQTVISRQTFKSPLGEEVIKVVEKD